MIQPIKAFQILDSPLLAAYEEECAVALLGDVKPDRALYERMEDLGILHCFGVFNDDSLRGFATVLTTVYPHYSKRVATVESLYVQGGGGSDLMIAVEYFARASGCSELFVSCPIGGRLAKLLDAKKSYSPTSIIYGKKL